MKEQLASIQVLRAVAALAVVLFHFSVSVQQDFHLTAQPFFPAGATGVDIFFVISGFIMAYTTNKPDQHSPGQFIAKRLARIAPLYWVLTLSIFALALAAPNLLRSASATPEELLRSLFFIPYARPDGMVEPVLFLGWTLNYEMFFYTVFAIALIVSGRWRLPIAMSMIAALAAAGYALRIPNTLYAFYTSGIMLEFVWGILLFMAFDRWPALMKRGSLVWILGAALLLLQNNVEFGLPREIEKGLPSLLIVAGVLGSGLKDGALRRAAARIGDASYSLYLGHPYALAIAARFAIAALGATAISAAAAGLIGLTLALGAALASFFLLERPSNDWLRSLLGAGKKPTIAKPVRQG